MTAQPRYQRSEDFPADAWSSEVEQIGANLIEALKADVKRDGGDPDQYTITAWVNDTSDPPNGVRYTMVAHRRGTSPDGEDE